MCDDAAKKRRGCIEPALKKVWNITECFICGGFDSECSICKGSNTIPIFRCPRRLACETNVSQLLPFFQRYLDYGEFPDKRGLLYQPLKLVNTLNLILRYYRKYELEDIDRKRREMAT